MDPYTETMKVLAKAGIHGDLWVQEQVEMGVQHNWMKELEKAKRVVAEKAQREAELKTAYDKKVTLYNEKYSNDPEKLAKKLATAGKKFRDYMREILRDYVGNDGVSSDEE